MYIICGFTDMIDGTVAGKTFSVSEFGSNLDTVADFMFLVACLIKLLPAINIPLALPFIEMKYFVICDYCMRSSNICSDSGNVFAAMQDWHHFIR